MNAVKGAGDLRAGMRIRHFFFGEIEVVSNEGSGLRLSCPLGEWSADEAEVTRLLSYLDTTVTDPAGNVLFGGEEEEK